MMKTPSKRLLIFILVLFTSVVLSSIAVDLLSRKNYNELENSGQSSELSESIAYNQDDIDKDKESESKENKPEETPNIQEETDDEAESVDLSDFSLQSGNIYSAAEITSESPANDLDPFQHDLYETLKAGIMNRETKIDISRFNINRQNITSEFSSFFNIYPELFFVLPTFSYTYLDEIVVDISPAYDPKYDDAALARFNNEVDKILSKVRSDWNDEQKALYIHDLLITTTEYDFSLAKYNIYDIIVDHSGICQGYSLAYSYLCNKLGIKCSIVSSKSLNHAWNLIEINGQKYYVDCTWDDPSFSSDQHLYSQACNHENFLCSQDAFYNLGHDSTDWVNERFESVYGMYNNNLYDDAYFKTSFSPILMNHNQSVYLTPSSDTVYMYDYSTNTVYLLSTVQDSIWRTYENENRYYEYKYWGTAQYNGRLYISGSRTIYELYPDGSLNPVYTLSDQEKAYGNIYGIYEEDNYLKYEIQQNPSSESLQLIRSLSLN